MSVSNEVLLDVQGLEKAYGGNQVLNGITTQIRRGEVVAVQTLQTLREVLIRIHPQAPRNMQSA